MDPVSAISLAGSVVGIVDVISRTIKSLQALRERWETADLTITPLIAQLSTLKAALNQVAKWISSSLAGVPQHHQLIIDLDLSLSSCNALISLMDRRISELDWNEASGLSFRSKVLVVLEDKATKDCQNHLNNQANALNLLLTAFNCRTQSEQKDLLEAEQSREVFKKVKDDSSSLVVIRDSASLLSASTNTTENSSKLSMRFMFDGELLQSKVYQGTIRSLLRRAMHGATATGSITLQSNLYKSPEERKEMKTRSRHIDRILHRDKLIENREFQILVHGRHQSGKSTICRMLELASSAEDSQSSLCVQPRQDPTKLINETKVEYSQVVWNFIEYTNSWYLGNDVPSMRQAKWDLFHLVGIEPSATIFVVDLSSVDPDMEPVAVSEEIRESVSLLKSIWRRTSSRLGLILIFHKIDTLLEKLGPDHPDARAATERIVRDLSEPFYRTIPLDASRRATVMSCHVSREGGNSSASRLGMDSAPWNILRQLREHLMQSYLDNLI